MQTEAPPPPSNTVGANQLTRTDKRKLVRAKNRGEEIVKQAGKLSTPERKCTGKVKLRDDAGEYLRDEAGAVRTRPCKNSPIPGGFVCWKHGGKAPQVLAKAKKRLLAMAEPALIRLGELAHQNVHPPTALGAVKEILDRATTEQALGAKLAKAAEKDTRPIINIGIVGGVPQSVTVASLPVLTGDTTEDV